MYVEINTAKKLDELELAFGNNKAEDGVFSGVPYAWNYRGGRYLISLINRNDEEMKDYFLVNPNGREFELPFLNKVLKTRIIFKPVETRWQDGHKDDGVRWIGRYKSVYIHISDSDTHNFFPYIQRAKLDRILPHESLCSFMIRQPEETQRDVFLSMVSDFVFPDIADWIKGGSESTNLSGMFRPEHAKFVNHMLDKCRKNDTLGWIDEYIRARNDASIALNSIFPKTN